MKLLGWGSIGAIAFSVILILFALLVGYVAFVEGRFVLAAVNGLLVVFNVVIVIVRVRWLRQPSPWND
jgi:hypothetical protein